MAVRHWVRQVLGVAVSGFVVFAIAGNAGIADATVVTSLTDGQYAVESSTTAGGSVRMVEGPGTPPSGRGSIELGVTGTPDRALVGNSIASPTQYRPWNGLGTLTYSTYTTSASPSAAPALKFTGYHDMALAPALFTTLNFVPLQNGTVVPNTWQTWTVTASSLVWQSNGTGGVCPQVTPCTLAVFMAKYPNGAWYRTQLGLGTNVAGPTKSYVDKVTIVDRGTPYDYDFEPAPAQASTASIGEVQWSGGSGTADIALNTGAVAVGPVAFDITVGPATSRVVLAAGQSSVQTVPVPGGTDSIVVRTRGVQLDSSASPGAPTGVTAQPVGTGTVQLTWTAPSGGADSYRVYLDGAGTVPAGTCVAVQVLPTCQVTGLQPGTAYSFRIAAVLGGLHGPQSADAGLVTAIAPPATPGVPAATVSGHRALSVAWTGPAPSTSAPVASYVVEGAPAGGGFSAVCAVATSPCVVSGLTVGTAYRFRVAAVNPAGTSAWSVQSPAVTAVAVLPGSPTGVTASPDDRTATVQWTPPASTTNVTGYTATALPGGLYCDATGATATGCAITGLDNGTPYTITVLSRGSIVDSASSEPATVTPSKAPGQPTNVVATPGISSVTVTWAAPDAGSGIDGYTVVASPGPALCETTGTSCVIGASAGRLTAYTVIARGTYGLDSLWSVASNEVTASRPLIPVTPPRSGSDLVAEPGPLKVAAPGQSIVLVGRGFAPYSTVRLVVFSTPQELVSVIADAAGEIRATVVVPARLSGQHTFVALGVGPAGLAHSLQLAVTVRAVDGLAVTGAPVLRMVVAGFGLTLAGLALLASTRRPRWVVRHRR